MTITTKTSSSDREIEGLLYEAENTVKKVKEPQDDYALLMMDANRHRETASYPLEKLVGKITISPWCTPETLASLNKANLTPHTILQMETW